MAYGNLPGGGFSGFVKAKKPLKIEKPSHVPVKEWPPDYPELKSKETLPEKEEDRQDNLKFLSPLQSRFQTKQLTFKKRKKQIEQALVGKKTDVISHRETTDKKKRKSVKKVKFKIEEKKPDEEPQKAADDDTLSKREKKPAVKEARETGKQAEKVDKDILVEKPAIEKTEEDVESLEEKRRKSFEKVKTKKPKKIASKRQEKMLEKDDLSEIIEEKKKEGTRDVTEDTRVDEGKVHSISEDELSEKYPEMKQEEADIRVKFRREKKTPTYTYYKRKRSLLRFCPCLDRLLHSRRMQYVALKAMFGFPIGAIFGFALYWIVLERMGGEEYLFWLLGIFVGIGFALSTQVRCICLLSIPACCGKAGRAFVNTYVVVYVMEGPLANIMANARESMRVISCTASLNHNHSVERYRLMFQPVKEIVLDFVGAGQKVQDDTKQLEKAFNDIEHEVRDEDEVRESLADVEELDEEIGGESRIDIIKQKFKRKGTKSEFGEVSDTKYGMKSELRCESVFSKGVRGCYDSFEKAYDRCHSYLPIIGYLLCWPMKLTFICDLASTMMGKRSCDSDDVRNPGFGASVDTADGVQSEFEKDFSVQLQYKLTIPEEDINQLVPEDVSGAMNYSFDRRKRNLDFFTTVIDRILAVLFLMVLNASRKYCNQYLRIIQFDNTYVTSYFRHIDARRKRQEKFTLLPLKKGEKVELSEPFSVKFSAEEKALLVVNGIRLISEVLSVSILLLFDRVFYEFLGLIQRHAHVTYKQTGAHHIKMAIYGNGFVGNMVRSILKGFDKTHSTDQVTTTEGCLPDPVKLKNELVIRIYLIFLLMIVFTFLEAYALRLRRVICSFFYPKAKKEATQSLKPELRKSTFSRDVLYMTKREKKRIIFLYNDRLKKRKSFLQHMRHRVREAAREQAIAIDSGVLFSLRMFYPKYFNWLSKLGLGLAKCLICKEAESKHCQLISCPECHFSYCFECFQDTEGKCYVCLPDDDTEPSDNLASDEEQEQLF